ncbi:MAG: dockerin type I domain-containing protein [Phycisphaerales bacterium]|jgi:hypothetical protein
MFNRNVVLVAGVIFAAAAASFAQPCGVLPGLAPGLTNPNAGNTTVSVNAFAVHDDGAGPALYIAGSQGFSFGYQSPNVLSCVARMRNGRLERVGASTSGAANAVVSADLHANLPGGPRLYAGGRAFRAANGPGGPQAGGIAMWDGLQWNALPNTPSQLVVQGMQAFDDGRGGGTQLYVAGSMFFANQNTLVSRWNGAAWEALPLPAPGGTNISAYDFAVFDDGSGPALYLAGAFAERSPGTAGGLAKWNGTTWDLLQGPVASASLTSVEAFAGPQGPAIFVGGNFVLPNDSTQGVARRNPDGTWSGLSVATARAPGEVVRLSALQEASGPALYVGGVYVAGGFTSGGYIRVTAAGATTTTRTYSGFSGFSGSGVGLTGPAAIFDAGFGPEVWIGGTFAAFSDTVFSNAATSPARSLLRFPQSANPSNTALEAGRGVNLFNSGQLLRPAARVTRIAGRDQLAFFGTVYGGGGKVGNAYALFDGTDWTTFTRQTPMTFSAGVESREASTAPVLILAPSNGSIGYFGNGTEFVPYGAGANSFSDVRNLFYFDDGTTNGPVLYAQDASTVKRLVNGQWMVIYTGQPKAMMVGDVGQGPKLFLTGNFPAPGVGVWNGVTFQPYGPTVTFPGPPTAMVVHDDGDGPNLYVGFEGTATFPNQPPASRLARLHGNAWESLGQTGFGTSNVRLSLASFDDGSGPALYVAGDLMRVGNPTIRGFARWRRGVWEPVLDINTRSISGLPNSELTLAVLGNTLYLYGLFADTGLSLPGSQPSLTDANVIVGENLVAIRRCPPACFPDLNQDGNVDAGDIDYLINVAAGGANPTGARTDLNDDGTTDMGDVDVLINVVAGGACGG